MRSGFPLVLLRPCCCAALLVISHLAILTAETSPESVLAVRLTLAPALAATGAIVEVEIESEAEPGRAREASLDRAGTVWFTALPPSRYSLTARAPGSEPARLAIEVAAQELVQVDVVLTPVGQGGSRAELADRRSIGEGAVFSRAALDDLPAGGDVWALVETAVPFVIVDRIDNGGAGVGRSALMGGRGASWALTAVELGGIQVRQGSRPGLWAIAPDPAFAESVSVMSGLAPVEVGTPGVRVVLAPRMPGQRWRGQLDGSITTPGMVATNRLAFAPSVTRLESWRAGGGTAGGPVSSGTGVVVSAGVTRTRHQERDAATPFASNAATVFAHVVSRPGDRDQVRALGGLQRARYPFDGRRQFREGARDERATFGQVQVAWDRVGRNGARHAMAVGLQRSRFMPQDLQAGEGLLGATVDRVTDGVILSPPESVSDSVWTIDAAVDRPIARWSTTSHAFRAGISVRRGASASRVLAAPMVGELVAGLPARVWRPQVPPESSHRAATELAVFMGDRIIVAPAFSFDAGLRLDLASGSARGAVQGITWTSLSPRLSFRWSPARMALFGGYGRYAAVGALAPLLTFGDPGVPTYDVHRWTDANGNGLLDAGQSGTLVARAGRGGAVAEIDPDLRMPMTTEWTIGAEYRQGSFSTLRGAIVIRRQDHLVGSVNTGVPFAAYRMFTVPDINADEGSPADDQLLPIYERLPDSFGDDAFLLTNPEGARATYEGIELTWELRSSRWFMLFGATAYRAEGLGGDLGAGVLENDPFVVGARYEQPNAALDEPGRLFFDRAYVGKWSATYRAPHDIRAAFTVRYQDGQPFTRMVVVPDLAAGPEMVQAYPMGRTRFTYTGTIDVRIEKGFSAWGGRAAVRLDAFNLTNLANEVEEDVVTGPTFRQSTAVQPPLTLRLGFRVHF